MKMTQEQKYSFVRFVLPHLPLSEFSGMKCAGYVRETYGIDIDYHVYSDVLDSMRTLGMVEITGYSRDGMILYCFVTN